MITIKKILVLALSVLFTPALRASYCEMGVVKPMREEPVMMSAVIQVKTADELNKHKKSGKPMVVKFYADWCGPCKEMIEPYMQLAKDYADIIFISIDGDKAHGLMNEHGIEAYPTLIFFDKNGTQLYLREGGIGKGALMDLVDKLKNGTMQKQEVKPTKTVEKEPAKAVKEEPTKKEQTPKKTSRQKSSHAKSSPKKPSAPKEIIRKEGGKRVRYVAVEDE